MFVSLFSLALGRLKSLFRAFLSLLQLRVVYFTRKQGFRMLTLCKCTEALFCCPIILDKV